MEQGTVPDDSMGEQLFEPVQDSEPQAMEGTLPQLKLHSLVSCLSQALICGSWAIYRRG